MSLGGGCSVGWRVWDCVAIGGVRGKLGVMASASVGEASGDQSVVWPLPSLDIDPD